ncbi:MAG: hypothetical protein AMXMBFR84_19090 [Candidatus Hydrogenedentota bacterium]
MNRYSGIAVLVVLLAGCGTQPDEIRGAEALVTALMDSGIPVTSRSAAPMPTGDHFRFDEGIRIEGPGLLADVLRIEDNRVFDIAKSAGRLLVATEAVVGQPIPESPDVYARHPFVVVIRQQPGDNALREALATLIPQDGNP